MKSPHVEVQDFDNDGWPDIYTSIVKFRGDEPHPVIFRNLGAIGGEPRFKEFALAVNDFPTAEDRKMASVGPFFEKMEREHKIVYTAPGPSCDFDRDGRLDLFLGNWWVKQRSLLLKNESKAGNWLQVAVSAHDGVNRNGIGSVVRVYPAGKRGQSDTLLCAREIAVGYGYASGQEAIAHIGLGDLTACDIEVVLPHSQSSNSRRVWFLTGFGSESVVAWLRQGRSTRRRRVSSICSGRVPPSEPWNDGFQGNSSRLASVTRPGAHTVSAVLEKSGRRRAGRSVSAGTEPGDVTRRSTSPCRKYEAAGERPQAASPSVNLRSRHAPGQVEQHHLVQMTHAGESKVVEV